VVQFVEVVFQVPAVVRFQMRLAADETAAEKLKLSIASPWSFPESLLSIHRIQRFDAEVQADASVRVPPTFATLLAVALPSRVTAVVPLADTTGEVQLKVDGAAVHVVTPVNVDPNPYCIFMDCASAFPPFLHCSPSKFMVNLLRDKPVVLLKLRAM
jgi:hypothetical protein